MSEALDWTYRVAEIPDGGLRVTREASEAERTHLIEALGILGCQRLVAEFTIRAIGKGHYRLAGKVAGELTQACVVSLEPVAQSVEGSFDVEFWPEGSLPEAGEEEIGALGAAEIEPVVHGRIDAGRIVFETVATSLDPYPRKPGAIFEADAVEDSELFDAGPFAALRKLKDRS